MTVFIRSDASLRIGYGHVMRCLALADALRKSGVTVDFICRKHPGNLSELIELQGFIVHELLGLESGYCDDRSNACDTRSEYGQLLGTTQEKDAYESIAALQGINPEWMIVDHYALDRSWERMLRPHVSRIMVIDDLADRHHDCDLLLDQNFALNGMGRYNGWVSPAATLLLGPEYALLRSEFSELRKQVKSRSGEVHRVLVFFGGSDPENITWRVLEALSSPAFTHLDIDVVLGAANPHRTAIEKQIQSLPLAKLHIQIDNMAELMCKADLFIGAGGSTTWERLCLGLPSLVVTIADNQVQFTRDLHNDGLLRWLGASQEVDVVMINEAIKLALQQPQRNRQESESGMRIVDGNGAARVSKRLYH
jgi:UDP-2,4-diacetamido-2,4,6-trideoxy-beta-L-altropyranose hydrolase